VVFRVAHRDPGATLYWHLDDRYLGSTATYHEQAVDVAPGRHVMTVVDRDGNRARREFEVLANGDTR
jgi:penicillin-binding protein 1C